MERKEIETNTLGVITSVLRKQDATLDKRFTEDLGGDSIDAVDCKLQLEEIFGINFIENDIWCAYPDGTTIKDICDNIEECLNKTA